MKRGNRRYDGGNYADDGLGTGQGHHTRVGWSLSIIFPLSAAGMKSLHFYCEGFGLPLRVAMASVESLIGIAANAALVVNLYYY